MISGITVYLYGATSKNGIDISNKIGESKTNTSGAYKFTGVETGNYVVVFEYDSEIYGVTSYQISTAKSTENSDVISKSIDIDGETKICALTDTLTVDNLNLINIDMGLVLKNEFNLTLNKYIESIKVTNDSGTKIYEYGEGENIKLEIKSKDYVSSNLEITYKIVISNNGDISGYVNKIKDYLPEGTTIDLSENDGWYYGEDGSLYYASLVGTEIKAGEQKEVIIVLRKSLAEGQAVTITNSGEIIETMNSLGLKDINSEDDSSEVKLIVSISTGNLIRNIFLTLLISMILIGCSIYIYRNYGAKRRIK